MVLSAVHTRTVVVGGGRGLLLGLAVAHPLGDSARGPPLSCVPLGWCCDL